MKFLIAPFLLLIPVQSFSSSEIFGGGPSRSNQIMEQALHQAKEQKKAQDDLERQKQEDARRIELQAEADLKSLRELKSKILELDSVTREIALRELAHKIVENLKTLKNSNNQNVYRIQSRQDVVEDLLRIVDTVSEPWSEMPTEKDLISARRKRMHVIFSALTLPLSQLGLALIYNQLGFSARHYNAGIFTLTVVSGMYFGLNLLTMSPKQEDTLANAESRSPKTVWQYSSSQIEGQKTITNYENISFHTWMPFWNELEKLGIELPKNYWEYEGFLKKLIWSAYEEKTFIRIKEFEDNVIKHVKCNNTLELPVDQASKVAEEEEISVNEVNEKIRKTMTKF